MKEKMEEEYKTRFKIEDLLKKKIRTLKLN